VLGKCCNSGRYFPNNLSLLQYITSRFADILGLELNMIKVFTDEVPRVPISAFTDLDLDPSEYQVIKHKS